MNKNIFTILTFALLSVTLILSAGFVAAVQLPVNLGTAGDFAILTKSGISSTGTTSITGDIGVSPIDHTAISGFGLIGVPSTDTFLTSALVTGKVYAANLVPPTPSNIGTSISNMETAYTDAQGRTTDSSPEDTTELGAGDISGKTIVPGLHKWSSGLLINTGGAGDPNGITLDCSSDPNGVFIFQVAQDLVVGPGARVTLISCKSSNIFWAVAGGVGVAIDTTAHFEGNILSLAGITLNTGATINGRLLAQTAVTLDANTVTGSQVPVLTTITLPPSTSITVGSSLQLNASSFDQFNASINTTISYVTNDSSIATVNSTSGLVTAIALGMATITASNGTVNGSINITVNPAPTPAPAQSQSSGGHGSSYCSTQWTCTAWNSCSNGQQTRDCTYPANWCIPKAVKPIESQSCILTSTPEEETPSTTLNSGSGITGNVAGTGMSGKTIALWTILVLGLGTIVTLVILRLRK